MRYLNRPQIITLAVAVVAVVLLLLLPRTKVPESSVETEVPNAIPSDYLEFAIQNLSDGDLRIYENLRNSVESTTDPLEKIGKLDSLSKFWDSKNEFLPAADALYEIALIIEDKPSYFIAGDKYFQAFTSLEDERKSTALKKAMSAYESVLEKNPEDPEATTSLAVCYIEGSAILGEAPMKGIGMLRKVLEKDPKNINALINLGYFSTKSGQYEKAIERFKEVLEIDPGYADAYLYLSETYLQMGNNEEAANYLEKYKNFLPNKEQKQQLDEYIEKIRNNNI